MMGAAARSRQSRFFSRRRLRIGVAVRIRLQMMDSTEDRLPEQLLEVADRLREERVSVSPLELDELKQRARAQAARGRRSTSGRKGLPLRSRVVTLALTALLIGGTTAGGLPAAGGGGGRQPAPPPHHTGPGGWGRHPHPPPTPREP